MAFKDALTNFEIFFLKKTISLKTFLHSSLSYSLQLQLMRKKTFFKNQVSNEML